jgi:gluconate kinase
MLERQFSILERPIDSIKIPIDQPIENICLMISDNLKNIINAK